VLQDVAEVVGRGPVLHSAATMLRIGDASG
jgi:hypothetical protein